jgi:MFS superfamily sulfate permease-like transporter
MPNAKIACFVLCAVAAHILLLALLFVFLGLAPAILLSILVSCAWIIYCSCKETPLNAGEDEPAAGTGAEYPVLPMALAGGPCCWVLCPTCLFPFSYGKSMELGFGWSLATGILRSFCRSLLKLFSYLYEYCADVYARVLSAKPEGRP